MKRTTRNILLLLLMLSTLISCEENTDPDTTPPSVTILNPQTGTTVNEITAINCVATDNDKIDYVELWVDGEATTITDETEPYSLTWDITPYENESSHTITVRAYDVSQNKTDSNPISLTVDNTGEYPVAVEILSVIYQQDSFLITWTHNSDNDFFSYSLFESIVEDMSGKTLIYEYYDEIDTTFIVTNINANELRYYQISVKDSTNHVTQSNIMRGSSIITIIYTANSYGNNSNIYIYNVHDNNYIELTNYTNYIEARYPIWKPDGTKIYYVRYLGSGYPSNQEIFQMDLSGENKINITNNQGYDSSMKICGESRKIVFRSLGDYPMNYHSDIFIMNTDGSNRTNLTTDSTADNNPDISFDGEKIVWSSDRTGLPEIFMMNSDGNDQIQLTDNLNGTGSSCPNFSPDGLKIIFSNNNDIYIMNSEGGCPTNLFSIGSSVYGYTFTPDGTKIVFISNLDNEFLFDIYVINVDGSNLTNLTNGFSSCGYFDVSEDGQRIVFTSSVDGNSEINLMDIDGNNRTRITNTFLNESSPKFRPNQ